MNIKIKRVDKTLSLPAYKTSGAVAFDVSARETVTIPAGQVGYIPLNVIIEVPENCWVLLAPRSSTHKLGLTSANGIGIGDRDFCGERDEYVFAALNFTQKEVTVERGTRVAQMMVMQYQPVMFTEVESFRENNDRGGFGTTGLK